MPENIEVTAATPAINTPVILRGPWLFMARAGWVCVALLIFVTFAAFASRGMRLLLLEKDISDSYGSLARLMSYAAYTRIVLAARYTILAAYLLTAVFIFWRRSRDAMGLLTSLVLLTLPVMADLGGVALTPSTTVDRGVMDSILVWYWPLAVLGSVALLVFLNVFPTGRFPAPWARRLFLLGAAWQVGLTSILIVINNIGVEGWETLLWPLWIAGIVGFIGLSIGSQVYRYRRVSGPVERQQTRWVIASLTLTLVWLLAVSGQSPFRSYDPWAGPWSLFKIFGTVIVLALLPLSVARAILRYHLWDIDVIVRKTLVYTLLTGFLALVYLSSIVALQGVFSRLTGQDSTLATILSTLLIAALFLPVRRSVQEFIDRRFYRRKYDAAKVLEGFAATARDETDLDRLTAELVRVIQETMEPEHVSIWLMPPAAPRPMRADIPDVAQP
ncbi:MAG: hypothetical protein R3C43_00735 [Chloroflexota bacterium]